ncbi:MAG: transposase family protein [Acholeplasmataceae bacterium]|nr:transposase family protein [Acholeplasmataceae bacterium]
MNIAVQKLYPGTRYLSHRLDKEKLVIELESIQEVGECPYCGKVSSKVHSYYSRKFSDLPLKRYQTEVRLLCKKFFCLNDECKHRTFSESFGFIKPLALKTDRLVKEILDIYENNSSRKASLILSEMGISACKATVCNLKNKH